VLFGYPIEATKGNWLQACLCRMLRAVHAAIRNGSEVPTWPDLIPPAYRQRLRKRTGLRNRFKAYAERVANLDARDEKVVYRAIFEQNRIRKLLINQCICTTTDRLPSCIRAELAELSKEAFRLLGEFGIRDQQYRTIYENMEHKVCPFCGIRPFDAPGAPRENLDHYLPRSRYPFAGANPKNLVPMCGRCNSAYKGTTDVLWDGTARRTAFFPYGHTGVTVSLLNSTPFGGIEDEQHPRWEVSFTPDSEETQTWDDVFCVRSRYVRDVLSPRYESWLRSFADFCKGKDLPTVDKDELIDALRTFQEFCEKNGFSERGFLKSAVFEMLISHCQQDNRRLIELLKMVLEET